MSDKERVFAGSADQPPVEVGAGKRKFTEGQWDEFWEALDWGLAAELGAFLATSDFRKAAKIGLAVTAGTLLGNQIVRVLYG